MPHYRVIQYRRYHDSLVSEYFWQLENVMEVLRGRVQHQQRFKEATLSTVFSVVQNAGTIGSTVSAAGSVVLGFLGQYQEHRRVEMLTPEYLSGQWEELKKIVESTAEKAVERYRYFLEKCSEGDAVELGRVSAQRLWEYLPREKLPFTIENMLLGIFQGKSGRWQDDWRNTGLSESAENKRQTAEGALKHGGIAYCDESHQWHYALHPRDKDALFPKYGFMVLPEILAKTRISAKKYIAFVPSSEQAQLLASVWSTPVSEILTTEGESSLSFSLTTEVAGRLTQLETDWCSFGEWQNSVESRLEELQTQFDAHEVAIVDVKQNIVAQHEHLSRLQRNVMDISEARRFTYIPKPYFQPRHNLWKILEQYFTQENMVLPIAIVGSGGMGKTSLINQWAEKQQFSGTYHSIRRMVMDEISIESSLVDLAHDLHVVVEKRKQDEWMTEVAQIMKNQSWLMIWDNVENLATIEKYLSYFIYVEKQDMTHHLVVTSRDTTCWRNPIFVDTFSAEESVSYIEHQMKAAGNPWFDRQHAQTLSECFEYHPLALELAMGHVCLYQRPLDKYLATLEAAGITTLNVQPKKLVGHARINPNNLATLWQMELTHLTADAISLLHLMSFISAEGVRRELLENFLEKDQERCNEALLELRQHAFIKAQEHSALEKWKMHRLLQEVVRKDILIVLQSDERRYKNFLEKSIESFSATFDMQIKENGVDNVEEGVLHGNQWLIHLSKEGKTKEKSSTNFIAENQIILLFHVGSGENNLSYYQSAYAHLMSALAMQLIENPAHQNIVKIFNNLGVALMGQGEFSKAQECYLNTLDTLHTIFGKESNHPNIAGVLSNLGAIYQNKGDFVVAHDYYRQALDMQHIIFGQAENHPDIANTLNNLGAVCLHQNDVLSAKNYLHAALEMLHILFGKHANHQGIALALRNLGMLQLCQNNLSAARDYCQNALNMQRTIMGQKANHSDIAETLNGLGSACLGMNNFSLAKDYFKQALTMQRAILGKDSNHPSIALTLANLGLIGQTSEDFSAARDYYQQALTMQYALFGQEAHHPVIASILYQLGRISKDQNDFSAALTYLQQVLAMQYVLFGQDAHHPDISDTLHKLGEVCLSQNNLSQAQYYGLKRLRILFGQKAMDPEEALRLLGQLSTISILQGNTLDIHLMTITPLIELLLDSDINVRRNAAAALGTLAMDPAIQTSIAKTEGIARFVDLLSDADMEVRSYAARALTNLAKNNIDIMSDVGVLPLMRSLDNHDVEVLKFLLIMLVHQTSNNEYPIITIQTKDIESLTVLLSNDDSEIRAYAALIIGTLAYNTENQMVIARAGVMIPLIHLLSDNNVIARYNATRALMYLVNNNIENRVNIVQSGGMTPLVRLLDDNDVRVRKNVVWVLWNLAMNAENRALMTQAEALVPLMRLLSDDDVDVRKNTIAALKYLVLSTENHLIIAQTEGIVSMIRFLAEGDLSVQKNVVWILTQLAINPENKIAITQAGGVRPLAALLSDKDEDLQLRSASLLASLACSKEAILTKEELIRNNVISIYVTFLENMKANIRLAGITGILALASYHRASQQAIMQVPQIIQKLIGFLNETESNIIATSAGALSNIAGWKTSPVNRQGQNAIRENGAIPILVHLLNHEDNRVVENVCEALMTLSIDNIQNQIAMTDSNILPILEQLLITNHNSTFKEDAGKMIGYCKKILEQRQFVYQEDQQHLALSQAQEASKLGRASYNNGDYDKACEYIMRALTIYSVVYGQNVDHNRIADTLYSLGKVHRKLEDDFSALNYYTQALKMMRALQKKELNYNIAETLYELGKLYKQQNKGDLAKEHFQQAFDIYVSFPENICESEIIQLRNELSTFISITKTPQALYSARSGSGTNGERQETLNEKKCLVM